MQSSGLVAQSMTATCTLPAYKPSLIHFEESWHTRPAPEPGGQHGRSCCSYQPGSMLAFCPKTFLNKHTCVRQTSACLTPVEYDPSTTLTFDEATIRALYTSGHKFAYGIEGLRLEDKYDVSPCDSTSSRWRKINGECAVEGGICNTGTRYCPLDATTEASIIVAPSASMDTNPYFRDVEIMVTAPRAWMEYKRQARSSSQREFAGNMCIHSWEIFSISHIGQRLTQTCTETRC